MVSRSIPFLGPLPLPLGVAILPAVLAGVAVAQQHPAGSGATTAPAAVVVAKDGTRIAYDRCGNGPPLVLVASALATRRDASRLAALLAPSFTVFNYDRRGRGDSGDAERYAVAREVEDIEALVDAAGGRASLFGSSSGAVLALEAAAALGQRVDGLVLHEPPVLVDDSRQPVPDGVFPKIEEHLAAGRRGEAVAVFMQECVGVPAEMLAAMQRSPMWRGMETLAHTLPYDGAVMNGLQSGRPLPKDRWTKVRARTLIVDGERSDAFFHSGADALAQVLPGAKRHKLRGQDHAVVFMAPQVVVPVLVEFLTTRDPDAAGSRAGAGSASPTGSR